MRSQGRTAALTIDNYTSLTVFGIVVDGAMIIGGQLSVHVVEEEGCRVTPGITHKSVLKFPCGRGLRPAKKIVILLSETSLGSCDLPIDD